jgi:formylglycine-generating enzyme required for sulfatase activity
VAHEAIFRRWEKLREWIAAEREFLAWRSGLEAARRAWQAMPDAIKHNALLMGAALAQGQSWLATRAEYLPKLDREFIGQSIERERKARARAHRGRVLVYMLLLGIIAGLIGVINEDYVREQWTRYMIQRPFATANILPYVLSPEGEQVLEPGRTFRECAPDKDYCPEMVVVPAGEFTMGSPADEKDHKDNEGPQHKVTITRLFAVGKFDVTFAEWDACVSGGGCPKGRAIGGRAIDLGWGRGNLPVIYVNWEDAKAYLAWLSEMTGKPYRLLTEAEWEYAARANTTTTYYWGEEIGENHANCKGCGGRWEANHRTTPVGSFEANKFGLHDMFGDVWQWVEDCYHDNYDGAPTDSSPWRADDCANHVLRGGSWYDPPDSLRSAFRLKEAAARVDHLGFRVARDIRKSE